MEGDGCWSSRAAWHPGAPSAVAIELFVAGELRGTFVVAAGERVETLEATISLAPDRARAIATSADPIECSLEAPSWRCTVPADVALDVRLAPGKGSRRSFSGA